VRAHLAELGPGRGTLMADALRAAKIVPEFLDAIEVVLIESSPTLRAIQRERLSSFTHPPHPALSPNGGESESSNSSLAPAGGVDRGEGAFVKWLDRFDESLSDRPLFLIANEFFDALPVRQYVHTPKGWCERMVTVTDGKLAFALAPFPQAGLSIPQTRGEAEDGAVFETSPASTALAEEIGEVIARVGGAALIVDYGYAGSGFGETLQAVSRHLFAHILDAPGEADLSAHVDFAALAEAATHAGAVAHGPIDQSALLKALGIDARAAALRRANPAEADSIAAAVARLCGADKMGSLFKALAITPKHAPKPPGF
jgi:NADH dehydrogenase [ubiquinone] 1 alpha subcomplex assembly factor 7